MKQVTINNQTVYADSIKDLTDTQCQELAESLVNNEVYCQCTREVEYILQSSFENENAPFSFEDVVCGRFAEVEVRGDYIEVDEDDKEELIESLKEGIDILESRLLTLENYQELQELQCMVYEWHKADKLIIKINERIDLLNDSISNLEDAYFDPEDVFQWFSCSEWLAKKMSVYIDGWGYWGRTCCGQAIRLDSDIQKIAFDTYSREVTREVTHPDSIDFTDKKLIEALSIDTYPMLDKMAGTPQYNFVSVCNEIYKRQRVPKMVCNSGKYSLNVLDKSGAVIDTVLTVARLGSTSSSSFNLGLVEYLKDVK